MGAATRLQIDASIFSDGNKSDLAGTHRRFDGHGSHKARICLKFIIGDPAITHRMIFLDQSLEFRCKTFLGYRAGIIDIEIKSAAICRDLTTGHREGNQ